MFVRVASYLFNALEITAFLLNFSEIYLPSSDSFTDLKYTDYIVVLNKDAENIVLWTSWIVG